MKLQLTKALTLTLTCLIGSHGAEAALMTFTDQASFLAQLNSYDVEDFDTTPSGTTITNGSNIGDFTFNYSIDNGVGEPGPSLNLNVTSIYDTTSGDNYLGVDDSSNFDQIVEGNDFSVSFSETNAFGLYINSYDEIFSGDFVLKTAGTDITNIATPDQTLGDGTKAFFLGIIDTSDTFTSATLETSHLDLGGAFLYNADDFITSSDLKSSPVPEGSSSLICFLLGGVMLGFFYRRTK